MQEKVGGNTMWMSLCNVDTENRWLTITNKGNFDELVELGQIMWVNGLTHNTHRKENVRCCWKKKNQR